MYRQCIHSLAIMVTIGVLVQVAVAGEGGTPPTVAPFQPPTWQPVAGIGLHGDGSSVFPNDKPSVDFDEKTGRNLRWRIPLPNFGYSAPVPVGNRVMFLCEPDARTIWPVLRCFDAATGSEVWSVAIDPLDAFPDLPQQERQRVQDLVFKWRDDHCAMMRAFIPLHGLIKAKPGADHPLVIEANKQLAGRGIVAKGYAGSYTLPRLVTYPKDYKGTGPDLWKTYNIQPIVFDAEDRSRTGEVFGTPVADAERVYAITIHGTVVAVDIATGKRAWIKTIGGGVYREANHFMTSPRLYKGLLLAHFDDTNNGSPGVLVAYDAKAGEERWRHADLGKAKIQRPLDHGSANGRPGSAPMIATVDGVDVAILGTGEVFRLPDGHRFAQGVQNTVQQGAILGQSMYAGASSDGGKGHWRLDLAIKNGELEVTPGWFHPSSGFPRAWGTHPVAYDGRLFWQGYHVDPATGCPPFITGVDASITKPTYNDQSFFGLMHRSKEKNSSFMVPQTRMFLLIAGGHVYALDVVKNGKGKTDLPEGEHGELMVYTVDGKRVSETLLIQPPTPQHLLDQGWPVEPTFAYTCAMNIGNDSLYIASDQFLYCIGAR